VSGINASGFYGDQTDLLMGTPEHSIYHWMDGYCKSNPRGTVHTGANALLRDLYNSAQKRRVANNSAGRWFEIAFWKEEEMNRTCSRNGYIGIESMAAPLAVEGARVSTGGGFNASLKQADKSFASTVRSNLDDKFSKQSDEEIRTICGDFLPDEFLRIHSQQTSRPRSTAKWVGRHEDVSKPTCRKKAGEDP
jgi:hypothetical protein